jgi:adenylate cyclase
MPERVQRRLAAILAADMVGYSRLVGQEETGTLRRLRELRRTVIDPAIKTHRGRVVKTTGDDLLVEFPSAVEAVRLAVAVQRAMVDAESATPADRRIAFRVGVHQGDVVVENDDLFGDGVNVAARLETLSEPGGICVSGRVHEDTMGRLDLPFVDRGQQQVKNIARPVHVYSLGTEAIAGLPPMPAISFENPARQGFARWPVSALSDSLQTKSWLWLVLLPVVLALAGFGIWQVAKLSESPAKPEAASQARGPTIAVLPFDNLSGDPAQDSFSQGISEELITALSRFDHLHVLARNTTFAYKGQAVDVEELGRKLHARYVIEGSLRRVPDQISVTAQLIDARTGTHVWAQTYDRPAAGENLLVVQNDIAQRIATAVGDIRSGKVASAELEQSRTKPTAELSSYECVVNAAAAWMGAPETVRQARACLELTVKRDSAYVPAWVALARILSTQRFWGIGLSPPDADDIDKRANLVPRVVDAANKAVELARGSAEARLALFEAYYAACEPERMRVEADRVLAINPNDANALGTLGNYLAYTGSWDYGRQLAEKAIAFAGPGAPRWWWDAVAKDYYRKGEYDKALEYFRRSYIEQNWLDHPHVIYTRCPIWARRMKHGP